MKKENIKKELKKNHFLISNKKIYRQVKFKNLKEVGLFINNLSAFCDRKKHYPEKIIIKKSSAIIVLSSEEKLSEEDIVLAREINSFLGWRKELESWLVSSKVLVVLSILFLLLILYHYLSR